jgi:hypothetical protein
VSPRVQAGLGPRTSLAHNVPAPDYFVAPGLLAMTITAACAATLRWKTTYSEAITSIA